MDIINNAKDAIFFKYCLFHCVQFSVSQYPFYRPTKIQMHINKSLLCQNHTQQKL